MRARVCVCVAGWGGHADVHKYSGCICVRAHTCKPGRFARMCDQGVHTCVPGACVCARVSSMCVCTQACARLPVCMCMLAPMRSHVAHMPAAGQPAPILPGTPPGAWSCASSPQDAWVPPSSPPRVAQGQGHPESTGGPGRLGCGCYQLGHPQCRGVWVLGGGQAGQRVLGRD